MSTNSIILVYSLPDLNRYSSKNQILSLTCLPIPPNEHVIKFIAQFDFSALLSVLITFLISWYIFYSFIALKLLPEVVTILKFRFKKLKNSLTLNLDYVQFFLSPLFK